MKGKYLNPKADLTFKKVFEQAEIAKFTEAERRMYVESRKDMWDNYSVMKTAHDKGHVEGREEGLAEGLEQGRAEGMTLANRENAIKMKADGMPSNLIAKYTGLTEEEIDLL